MNTIESNKKRGIGLLILAVGTVLFQNCSPSPHFGQNQRSPSALVAPGNQSGTTGDTGSNGGGTIVPPPPGTALLKVGGIATGLSCAEAPYKGTPLEGFCDSFNDADKALNFTNLVKQSTHLQLQYSITDIIGAFANDPSLRIIGTSYQIFPRGGTTSLALGDDGKSFGFAQYYNLEQNIGNFLFNIPLTHRAVPFGPIQALPVGQYDIYLWSCWGYKASECAKSAAIGFEVVP
jgi:hypothetical protein